MSQSDHDNTTSNAVADSYSRIANKEADSLVFPSALSVDDNQLRDNLKASESAAKARRAIARAEREKDENTLRRILGISAVGFVGFQLLVCNAVISIYVIVLLVRGQDIPSEVLIGWMSSALVEIIGILWVIARSLFPFKDKRRNRDAESR